MENDEKPNNEKSNKESVGQKVKEAKEIGAEAAKLAASASSGNVVQAAKSALKLAKSNMFKKAIKRKLMMSCAGLLALILIIGAFVSVLHSVFDKMIELASNIGKAIKSFWNWLTNDYWIKLDEDIEYTDIDDTRSGGNKKRKYSRYIYKATNRFRCFARITKLIR